MHNGKNIAEAFLDLKSDQITFFPTFLSIPPPTAAASSLSPWHLNTKMQVKVQGSEAFRSNHTGSDLWIIIIELSLSRDVKAI